MPTSIRETTLSNGMKIFCLREKEVKFHYEQIQTYLKHGIELHEGDTVFDVGANIGLFTLWLNWLYKNNVNIYAFEPIPTIFEVLKRNAQRFNREKIQVFPCGLSRESKTMTFAYRPNATTLSTAYPDILKKEQDEFKNLILENLKDAPPGIRWLRWIPPFLRSLLIDKRIERALQIEQVTCQVKTLSEIIREHNIQQIDLLKVDVEKSELDVLLGIEEQDWSKIKQVFVEIDDWDVLGEKITSLLKKYGFNQITVEQEPWLKGYRMFNLYALRQNLNEDSLVFNAHTAPAS